MQLEQNVKTNPIRPYTNSESKRGKGEHWEQHGNISQVTLSIGQNDQTMKEAHSKTEK